jgi:outer membrane immunogenic protein
LIYRLRTISLSACLMAAVLALTCKDAAAGFGPPANPAFGSNAANASSWLAGAHAGYNWQQGAAVFGFETDLQATHLNSTMSGGLTHSPPIIPLPASDFASTTALIEYYGTVRGRLGWSAGQWMFFGTAGSTFSTLGLRTFSQTSEQKIGWVVGAGFEYLLRPNLMLSLGYQYVDLGRIGISSTTTGISGPSFVTLSQAATVHAQFQTVMAGMSWRFAPGSSSPWAGGYAGGQGGGAWGNNTAATYASSQFTPSDMRLKRDIGLLARRDDGLGLYSFKYVWSDTVYVGVMAQEVALLYPDAVQRDDLTGYMAVNYTRLGLQPMILR